MTEELTTHDHRKRYCPLLGHHLHFKYCRAPASPLPCRRILDCWWRTFDVESFLRAHLSHEEIQELLAPRKDKMTSIVELIQKARDNQKDG